MVVFVDEEGNLGVEENMGVVGDMRIIMDIVAIVLLHFTPLVAFAPPQIRNYVHKGFFFSAFSILFSFSLVFG